VLMAGLIVILRRRSAQGNRSGGIDAMIVALGLALPSWVWLIAPYLHDESLPTLPKLVSVAYPLGDLMLLVPAVVLALDGGRRRGSFYLLSAGIVALLVTDFIYGLMILNGTYDHQLYLDIGWIGFYVLWGAAALHPAMRELDRSSPDTTVRLTRLRLALLAGASLIAPAILFVTEARQGNIDVLVVIGASVVLFGLVVARMAGLVRQQERSVARERVLSKAGAALAAATGREEIQRAVLDAIGPLLEGPGAALLCDRHAGGLRVVARSDATPVAPDVLLSPPTARALLDLADEVDRQGANKLAAGARAELHLDSAYSHTISLGLHVRGEVRGLLIVACPRATPEPVIAALRSLATNLVLALESVSLTEQVQRRRSEARFKSLVQHASDLITVVGQDATVTYQSPSSERVLGYAPEELLGVRFDSLLVGGDRARLLHLLTDGPAPPSGEGEVLECTLRHKDGTDREFEILHTNLIDDEHVHGVVLNARDVSERKAFEEQLAHQAFHDAVTGLPNRAFFVERVRQAIARARREQSGLAIIFLDLDDFKTINDSLGHAAGDGVLLTVAKRLDASVRASDTAARFGGDEFAVLLEDIGTVDEGAETAARIIEALAQPLSIGGKELILRCSMGISVLESEGRGDADELIRNADAAMYIAKRDGKGAYRLFEPAMHEGVVARLELRADLQRALTAGEFELVYQPVVHLSDGSVAGLEALLRWRHPERGVMIPDSFISFAEETGLIVPIGRWVLREACRMAAALQVQVPFDPPLTMSVNLSVKQLQHSDVAADVRDALTESGLAPELLTLEITESVLMTDTQLAVQRLEELREIGVVLAMDDFGTGYSSLSYLSRFPVDVLKMDRSFLRDGATPQASGLARAVVALGETLQLNVVAEGIEHLDQWTRLRDLGCDRGQGFYFARPLEAGDVAQALRTWPAGAGSADAEPGDGVPVDAA
jgi:diguanylate cyclase (GGDEF)-like protein/PAS domain S-box-containing protein